MVQSNLEQSVQNTANLQLQRQVLSSSELADQVGLNTPYGLVPVERILFHPPKYIQSCVQTSEVTLDDFHRAKEFLKQPIECLVYDERSQALISTQFRHLTSKICSLCNRNIVVSSLLVSVLPSVQQHIMDLARADELQFQQRNGGRPSPLCYFTHVLQLESDIVVLREEDVPFFVYYVQILISYSTTDYQFV